MEGFKEENCVICLKGFETETAVDVSIKGIRTMIEFCQVNGKYDLQEYLNRRLNTTMTTKILVHVTCRRNLTDPSRICSREDDDDEITEEPCCKKLRSSTSPLNWKKHCLLCTESAEKDQRRPEKKIVNVTTVEMRDSLLKVCDERNDEWADEVRGRLAGCIDLLSVEAVYHATCMKSFRLIRCKPNTSEKSSAGRKTDEEKLHNFNKFCDWLDNDTCAELYTLSEMHTKMLELANANSCSYTIKRFKQKLKEYYKEHIFFAEVKGRGNVVCFKNMANYIINDKWYTDKKTNIQEESQRIIMAAAKIIKEDIRSMTYDMDVYPTEADIKDAERRKTWIPDNLLLFLEVLIGNHLKRSTIAQCIIQASRPRSVICPSLFGLGIEMDHVFGSSWLTDELQRLGLSIGYDEVNRYKQSVIQSDSTGNIVEQFCPGSFIQWVGDNVDHNVATLDGKATFHGMGLIAVSTPTDPTSTICDSQPIKRMKRLKVEEVVRGKGVPIVTYIRPDKSSLSSVRYKPIIQLQTPYTLPEDLTSDMLWHSASLFNSATNPRPNWSGFMQHTHVDGQNTKSDVKFLPIINLNPSDETCIYSTLVYIKSQSQQLNIITPCITFDQPLWLKATEIIKSQSMGIVCRLGGFHLMMSFLGSIGTMMSGSGIEEALGTVYGENTVTHIMSGKAVGRALRGNFIVQSALMNKLTETLVPTQVSACDVNTDNPGIIPEVNTSDDIDIERVHSLYDGIYDRTTPLSSIQESFDLQKLETNLNKFKDDLSQKSRTAKLWIQYIEYVEMLRHFIRAERTGNWNLHIVVVTQMLNLFAATGHNNYAKSARLYLQEMSELSTEYPWLYNCFMNNGYHTIRRSERFWAGLWTDLVIEQVLMRTIKSRGGLTRGRGMTETVRLQWVYSMHKCASIHNAMTQMNDLHHTTSQQHVDLGTNRRDRDYRDTKKVDEWLQSHEPFDTTEPTLRSLSSGLTAADGDCVNCDQTEVIGARIHAKLDEKNFTEVSLKRNEQIVPLEHLRTGVKLDKDTVHVKPGVLFSRLTAIAQREDDMSPYFAYELCPVPSSLFKDDCMRKTDKSKYVNKYLTLNVPQCNSESTSLNVLDGGALVHKVKWNRDQTYKEVALQYVKYVRIRYGNCVVVFDGYNAGPGIKDHEHMKRTRRTTADIRLNEESLAHSNQHAFLANAHNKSQFIDMLSRHLRSDGQSVKNSEGDADVLIVSTALNLAENGNKSVTVVADDTDVFVLLVHMKPEMSDIYFRSEANVKQVKLWNIRTVRQSIDENVLPYILLGHAWTGCDSTSAIFGLGKCSLIKKLAQTHVRNIASTFNCEQSSQSDVGSAGNKLFMVLYGAKKEDSLATLRFVKYMEMVTSSKCTVEPHKLPPTSRAAYYHSLRVFLQVSIWKSLSNTCIDPLLWGWKSCGPLIPVMTHQEAAPQNLLKFIRCHCKLITKSSCSSELCTCKKNGLKCVVACGDCRGVDCQNAAEVICEDGDITVL